MKHFEDLKSGDIVRSKFNGNAYVIIGGDFISGFCAVDMVTVTNPPEWEFFDPEHRTVEPLGWKSANETQG